MDWAQIVDHTATGKKLTALISESAVLILSLSHYYRPRRRWNVNGGYPSDSDWNDIEHAISEMENEIMSGLIGAVIPHVLADITGLNVLLCDGATYARIDYPELYAVISTDLIIDADYFLVPDLIGRFPRGADIGQAVGFEGGESEHLLTDTEMPSHTHGNFPHSHGEIIAAPALADLGTGVPVPSAVPAVGSTSPQSITIDSSGGGQAHNNEPQYTALSWFIIAK